MDTKKFLIITRQEVVQSAIIAAESEDDARELIPDNSVKWNHEIPNPRDAEDYKIIDLSEDLETLVPILEEEGFVKDGAVIL